MVWLKTKTGWYVHEIRGVCFLSFVAAKDRSQAARFPAEKSDDWQRLLSNMAEQELIAVPVE